MYQDYLWEVPECISQDLYNVFGGGISPGLCNEGTLHRYPDEQAHFVRYDRSDTSIRTSKIPV